jgi:hypothetical protein
MLKMIPATLLVFTCTSFAATTAQEVLVECSKVHDHPQTSACVILWAKTSSADLARVESDVRNAIAAMPKDIGNLRSIRSKFETSSRAFKVYRRAQCRAQEEFSRVSMYAAENGLACEIELNLKRIDELNAGLFWLK